MGWFWGCLLLCNGIRKDKSEDQKMDEVHMMLVIKFKQYSYIDISTTMSHHHRQRKHSSGEERSRSRSKQRKDKHREHRNDDRNRDRDRGRDWDRRQERSRDQDGERKNNFNRGYNNYNSYNNRNRNQSYNNNYNNRNNNRNNYNNKNQGLRQIRCVHQTEIDPPKQFTLSEHFTGQYRPKITKSKEHPTRVEPSNLGELKNKITPIQKLWSSHIKQYLNISQFVQIYRPRRSLAFGDIQYGKTMIRYEEEPNIITYDNGEEQAQIFSRAYFKLWEILETGVLKGMEKKELSIGCVAEGPGGFIHALVDYRLKQQKGELRLQKDVYNAITLRIDNNTRNAKDWSDNRGKRLFQRLRENAGQKIFLSYGSTGTGDLLKTQNIEHFSQQVKQKCFLVTGDGGIQCIGDKEFQFQEVFNSKLFLGQIITALHIQALEGKFILKIYDIGFEITRQLILLLAVYYQKVRIIKPITSRPGNSEKYLLCEGFRGISEEKLGELKRVLEEWTAAEPKLSYFQNQEYVHTLFDFTGIQNFDKVYKSIKEANDWFVDEQIQKIEEGLGLQQKHRGSERSIEEDLRSSRWQEQMSFAYEWCRKYRLSAIDVEIEERSKAGEGKCEMKDEGSAANQQGIMKSE